MSARNPPVLLLLCLCAGANAQGRWESATNTGQESSGDPMLTRCTYQTIGGYRFSSTYRGICPFSVDVNPETGKVRTSQSQSPSPDRLEQATNVGQEPTGDSMLTRCIYQTVGGYQFSTTQRGLCAYTVQVNPQTGKVNAPQSSYESPRGSGGNWDNATNIGQEPTGDGLLSRCLYETTSGYRFSTTSRGLCEFSVQVNPENRQVR